MSMKKICALVHSCGYRSVKNLCTPVIMKERTVATINYHARDVR